LIQGFSLVIATNLDEKTIVTLSNLLWESNTPLMIVKSYGLVGYIRLQVMLDSFKFSKVVKIQLKSVIFYLLGISA
jgi:hypothetical protein